MEPVEITNTPLLCGVHATYVALSLIGDEHVSLDWIIKQFPNAMQDGVSLKEIENTLKEKNYFTNILPLNEEEILKKPVNNVYVVLVKQKGGSHLIVKKKTVDNKLMIVDFPTHVETYLPSQAQKPRLMTLVISTKEMPFAFSGTLYFNVLMIVALLLIVVSLFVIVKRKARK